MLGVKISLYFDIISAKIQVELLADIKFSDHKYCFDFCFIFSIGFYTFELVNDSLYEWNVMLMK